MLVAAVVEQDRHLRGDWHLRGRRHKHYALPAFKQAAAGARETGGEMTGEGALREATVRDMSGQV